MPVTLRQRLDCHYCGRRSKQTPGKKRGGKFQCENCLAVNYFDENGELADVPLGEAAPAQQWAQPVTDPLADDFPARDSIFCSVCLKNQHVYNYTLSQYLPDPDHPNYDRLEAELPEYKKGLERRYPQCCAKCEPKVRAQLLEATYNARTDHIRRVMERSRQRRIGSRWGWRRIVVNAAGLGYSVSLIAQVLWHLYGSQVSHISFVEVMTLGECLDQRAFRSQCLDVAEPVVGLSLAVGLLCVWWNSKWQHKLLNPEGRLVGLHEYYMAQFILLGLRFSAWIVMTHSPISMRTKAMLHAGFAVTLSVLTGWSVSSIVKVRLAPLVNWHQDPAPLLTSKQFVPPTGPEPLDTQRPQDRPFSVNSLAGPTRPIYRSWNPPTPPPDGAEAMDWTPSQPTFQPQSKQIRYTALEPTPFHGTLPAVNTRGVHRNQNQAQTGRQAIGLPPGFFDKASGTALPPRQNFGSGEAMAQPTFFGYDRESDTGLEGIFDTVFSLQDRSSVENPPISGRSSNPGQRLHRPVNPFEVPVARVGGSLPDFFICASLFFILVALATWIFEAAVTDKTSQLGYCLLWICAIIPLGHIVIAVQHGAWNQLAALIFYAFEAGALVGLALLRDSFGNLFRSSWNIAAMTAIGLLLPQEFVALNRSFKGGQPQQRNMQTNPAPYKPMENAQQQRPVRKPTMAETSRAIMPGLLRRISNDSGRSDRSDSEMTEPNPWETPAVQDSRFQYVEPVRPIPMTAPLSNASTFRSNPGARRLNGWKPSSSSSGERRPANGTRAGMDGLGLGNDNGVSRNENTGITNMFGRTMNLTSPGTNTGPRARQRL